MSNLALRSCMQVLFTALALMLLPGGPARAVADDAEATQQVDIYGDPLPDGAIARLGTVRYRRCAGAGRIEFLPDGQTLLGCSGGRLAWLDVSTGRTVQAVDIEGDSATLLAVTSDRTLAAVNVRTRATDQNESTFGLVFVDTTTGSVRSRLQTTGETVRRSFTAAGFTPDGARLVTGDYEGVLRVWSVANGSEERSLALSNSREVQRIDFSRDGRWLVACNYQEAYRWEWRTADAPIPFGQPDERVLNVEFSPDGRTIAMGADSHGGIRLFAVESGRQTQHLTAPSRYFYPDQLAFTTDGSRLAAPSRNSLRGVHEEPPGELDVWDVESGELVHAFPFPEGLRRVAISPDDRWIAATVYEGTVAAWDLETGAAVGDEFFGHLNRFGTLAASPDGTQVATAGNKGMAVLWNAESGQPVHVLRHQPGKIVRGLAFSPDGNLIATSAFDDTVVIWDRGKGERVYTLQGHGDIGGMRAVSFSADSRRLMSFGDDWFLRVFDVGTGKALLEHAIRPSDLPLKSNIDGSLNLEDQQRRFLMLTPSSVFTTDGQTMVLSAGSDVYMFDVETGTERQRHQPGLLYEQIALSRDGTRLATLKRGQPDESPVTTDGAATLSMYIQITKLRTGEVEHTIPIPEEPGTRIAFAPDGSKLATTARVIRVYDIATGNELARIEPDIRASYGLTFTPDGDRLVATHADTTALVWDWKRFLIGEEVE